MVSGHDDQAYLYVRSLRVGGSEFYCDVRLMLTD